MLNINNIIKTTATLALSAFAFASCMEIEDPQSGAVGYLALPSLDVDVTMDDLSLTKAASAPSVNAPSADELKNVRYVVKEKGTSTDLLDGKPWTEALTLPVDKTYVIEAYYGENSFDAAYFYGSKEVTIKALETIIPVCTLKVSNSLLCISTDPVKEHFTFSEAVLTSGDMSKHITSVDTWTFVPADSELTVVIKGTAASTGKAMTPVTHKLTPEASKAYNLICGKDEDNWPTITWDSTPLSDGAFEGSLYFKPVIVSNMSDVNASAVVYQIKGGDYLDWTDVTVTDVEGYKHISGLSNGTEYSLRANVGNISTKSEQTFVPVTYASCLAADAIAAHNNAGNPSTMLESTAVKASVTASLPAVIADLATSHTAKVRFTNGRVKESTISVNASKQTLSNADGWPYLPQGNYPYTAKATLSLPGDRTITSDLSGSVTVPAPEFTLTLSAYTSYDKYAATNGISKDVNGANNCDPATLYNAGGQWGISTAIMASGNYAKTLVVNIDGNTDRTFNVTNEYADNKYYENITGLAWQSHSLTVSMTFDGKTVSKSQTHHITGLPYSAVPPKNSGQNQWNDLEGNNTWKSDCVQLYYSAGKYPMISSPTFNIPSDEVKVNVATKIYREYYWASVAKGDIKIARYNNDSESDSSIYQASLSREATLETSWDVVMNTTYNAFYIQHRYMADTGKVNVYYFNVNYR